MMSPTPVSHTIVIIMRYDNFANFPLHSMKISIPWTTIRLKKQIYLNPQSKLKRQTLIYLYHNKN